MANAYELMVRIKGDAKGAVSALKSTRDEMAKTEKEGKSWGQRMNTAANVALGAAGALTAGIGVSIKAYEDFGGQVRGSMRMMDLSAEGASTLAGQFRRFGIDSSTASTGVRMFSKNLTAARRGSQAQVQAFESLGISMEQLSQMTDTEALFAMRDAFSEMGPSAERTAAGLALLGRGGGALMSWLSSSKDDMAELNKELERAGLIWNDEQVKTWGDMAKMQREMDLTLLGLKVTVAQEVVPALIPFMRQIGDLLRLLRPVMPILPHLTLGLYAFGGAVKLVRLGQMVSGLFKSAEAAEAAAGSVPLATRAFKGLSGAISKLPALLTSTGGLYGMIAAGIAVDTYLIYEAGKAWRQMTNAVRDAENAYGDYLALTSQADYQPGGKYYEGFERLAAKGTGMSMEDINKSAAQSKFKYSWWAGPGALLYNQGIKLPGFAGGGIARGPESGYLAVLHGSERVTKEPLPREERREPGVVVNVTGNTFVGTSRDAERHITGMVERNLAARMRRLELGGVGVG